MAVENTARTNGDVVTTKRAQLNILLKALLLKKVQENKTNLANAQEAARAAVATCRAAEEAENPPPVGGGAAAVNAAAARSRPPIS